MLTTILKVIAINSNSHQPPLPQKPYPPHLSRSESANLILFLARSPCLAPSPCSSSGLNRTPSPSSCPRESTRPPLSKPSHREVPSCSCRHSPCPHLHRPIPLSISRVQVQVPVAIDGDQYGGSRRFPRDRDHTLGVMAELVLRPDSPSWLSPPSPTGLRSIARSRVV